MDKRIACSALHVLVCNLLGVMPSVLWHGWAAGRASGL